MHGPDSDAHAFRSIRVFVSSTFRDMHEEREELIKRVFPQLRRLCETRGVAWSEVDLRWGVTDEQKAEGAVLPICLAEIDRSRPYFIGLLGQRYGWIPEGGAAGARRSDAVAGRAPRRLRDGDGDLLRSAQRSGRRRPRVRLHARPCLGEHPSAWRNRRFWASSSATTRSRRSVGRELPPPPRRVGIGSKI